MCGRARGGEDRSGVHHFPTASPTPSRVSRRALVAQGNTSARARRDQPCSTVNELNHSARGRPLPRRARSSWPAVAPPLPTRTADSVPISSENSPPPAAPEPRRSRRQRVIPRVMRRIQGLQARRPPRGGDRQPRGRCRNTAGLQILRGKGDGSFAPGTQIVIVLGTYPGAEWIGDYNGDGMVT